jgi:diguanylate cyclase (GGDEF)-like protein
VPAGRDDDLDGWTATCPYVPVVVAVAVGVWHVAQQGGLDRADSTFAALMFFCVLARQALLARDLASISDVHRYAAHHDALTGLANRKRFLCRLTEHLDTPGRAEAAVVLLDLDGFKEVNDTLGHEAGDGVLRWFAELLDRAAEGALVARLGGDEFAVLVIGTGAAERAASIAHRADRRMRGAGERGHGVRCSAGADRRARRRQRRRRAEDGPTWPCTARSGRVHARRRTSPRAWRSQAERRSGLASDLGGAWTRRDAPAVPSALLPGERRPGRRRALLRWTTRCGGRAAGRVHPDREEGGQISAVGAWVSTRRSRRFGLGARRALAALPVRQHQRDRFTADLPLRVGSVLRAHGLEASRLMLEVTESQLPSLTVNGAMQDLRAAGVRIALDDFGTGYSSLAQLARLPVDVLKIDRDFIRNIGDSTGRAILDAVIGLAGALGLSTVAEGIEDLGQAAEASNAGVDLGQGYLFRRPESPQVLAALLPPLPHDAPQVVRAAAVADIP